MFTPILLHILSSKPWMYIYFDGVPVDDNVFTTYGLCDQMKTYRFCCCVSLLDIEHVEGMEGTSQAPPQIVQFACYSYHKSNPFGRTYMQR